MGKYTPEMQEQIRMRKEHKRFLKSMPKIKKKQLKELGGDAKLPKTYSPLKYKGDGKGGLFAWDPGYKKMENFDAGKTKDGKRIQKHLHLGPNKYSEFNEKHFLRPVFRKGVNGNSLKEFNKRNSTIRF